MDEKKAVSDVSEQQNGVDKKVHHYKVLLTVCAVLLWVCMGFYDALFGPTLIDIKERLDVSTDQVTFARAFKEVGRIVGGLFGGIVSDRFQAHSCLFLGSGLILAGASVISEPWAHFIPVIGVLYFFEGSAQGGMDSVGNAMIASLWGAKADPAMHAIHFGYTVGSSLTPLMVANFLSPEKDTSNCTAVDNLTTVCPEDLTTAPSVGFFDDASQIEIAYGIAGGVTCIMGMVFLVMFCLGPPKGLTMHSPKKSSLREVFSPASCAGGRSTMGAVVVFLLIMFYVLVQAQGIGMWILNFTYAVESDLGFDKKTASLVDFTGKMCALASRGILIIASRWVAPPYILFYAVGGSAILLTLITFVGIEGQTQFWVLTSVYSLVNAGAWGAAYAFIDKYIVLYAFVVALSSMGAGLAGFAFQSLYGFLYENTVKESIYYLGTAMAWLWMGCTIIMFLVARSLGYRHGKTDDLDNEEQVTPENIMDFTNLAYEKDTLGLDDGLGSTDGTMQEDICTKL